MRNVFKNFAFLMTILLATPAHAMWPWSDPVDRFTYVVVNDTDVYLPREQEIYRQTVLNILGSLIEERKKSAAKYHHIIIMRTSMGIDPVFEGSPQDLFNLGGSILDALMEFKPKANDLEIAYGFVANHAAIVTSQNRAVDIIHIGKFFHVPVGFDPSQRLIVPQELPREIPLASILLSDWATGFQAWMVMAEQVQPLRQYLTANGVKANGQDDFKLEIRSISKTVQDLKLTDHMRQFDLEAQKAEGDTQ